MLISDAALPPHVEPTTEALLRHVRETRAALFRAQPSPKRSASVPAQASVDGVVAPPLAPPVMCEAAPFDPLSRLDALAVTPCNAVAVAAAKCFARGDVPFDLLLIHGPRGSGRSTLLDAVHVARPDVVAIDCVEARGGDLRKAREQGRACIVSADASAADLDGATARLLEGALVVRLEAPDDDLRRIVALRTADACGRATGAYFHLPPDVIDAIVAAPDSTLRTVQGLVAGLFSHHLAGRAADADMVADVLAGMRTVEERCQIVSMDRVLRAVCARYAVNRTDLLSQRRCLAIVLPRQIACYLIKTLSTRSLPEVGRRMGGRDHTTILHAVRKIAAKIEAEPAFAAEIEALKAQILAEARP